jgi:hypothetical protein
LEKIKGKLIKLNFTREDKIGEQLLSIQYFLNELKSHHSDDAIDSSELRFIPPLFSVFLSAIFEKENLYLLETDNSYFKTIHFPKGLKPDKTQNWDSILECYLKKSYIPLIHFSTLQEQEISEERNNVISKVNQLICKIAKLPINYLSCISYLISEITDNIVDHSGAERGWISYQYFPNKGFIDICIADSGFGLLESYKSYKGVKDFSTIQTHKDAIHQAILGNSTKHLNERGFGLHTSRELLIEGLKGKFIYFSGNALMVNRDLLDFQCNFKGTLMFVRIPCSNLDKGLSVHNYTE